MPVYEYFRRQSLNDFGMELGRKARRMIKSDCTLTSKVFPAEGRRSESRHAREGSSSNAFSWSALKIAVVGSAL
jgi:hypothetical protein